MAMSDRILDDLIEHEITNRRVVGSEQRKVDARMKELEAYILARLNASPPKTMAGVSRLEKLIKKAARQAFAGQDKAFRKTLREFMKAEQDSVNGAIEKNINGE